MQSADLAAARRETGVQPYCFAFLLDKRGAEVRRLLSERSVPCEELVALADVDNAPVDELLRRAVRLLRQPRRRGLCCPPRPVIVAQARRRLRIIRVDTKTHTTHPLPDVVDASGQREARPFNSSTCAQICLVKGS